MNELTLTAIIAPVGLLVGIALKWVLERKTSSRLADATVVDASTDLVLAMSAELVQAKAAHRTLRMAARNHFKAGCKRADDALRDLL